jgi:hypothetical protein
LEFGLNPDLSSLANFDENAISKWNADACLPYIFAYGSSCSIKEKVGPLRAKVKTLFLAAHHAKMEREHRERVVATAAAAAEAKADAPTNEEDDFKSVDDWMASGGDGNKSDDESVASGAPKSGDDIDVPPKTPKSFSLPTTQEELDAFHKLLEHSNLSSLRTPDAVTFTDLRKELDRRDESMKKIFEKILQGQPSPRDLPPGAPPTFRGAPINLRRTFDFSHEPGDSGGGFGKSPFAGAKDSQDYGGVKNPFSNHSDNDDPGNYRRSTNPFDDEDDEDDGRTTPVRDNHRSGRTTPSSRAKSPYLKGILMAQSPLNDPRHGKMNDMYLWGVDGCPHLPDLATDEGLLRLGFDWEMTDELMPVIVDLLDDWTTPDVKPKYIDSSFKRLSTIDPDTFIEWYTHLCQDLRRYNIGLVPFDCILVKWANVGLCPPGVGSMKYLAMAKPLFSILDHLLPKSNLKVRDYFVQLSGFQHDGYKLLDSVMARTLPVFCTSIAAVPPRWQDVLDVTSMGRSWTNYFRYIAKRGASFTDVERSLLFLDSIQEHALVGLIASLKGSIQLFKDSLDEFEDDTPLPPHLNINGIVSTMTTTTSPITSSMTFAASSATTCLPDAHNDVSLPNIQGALSNATVARRVANRRVPSRRPQGESTTKDVVCRTCGLRGHVEVDCRHLGRLLVMPERVNTLLAPTKKKVIENFKRFYGLPMTPATHRTACKELEDWCMARNVSEDEVVAWYNWDCLNPQDGDNDSVATSDEAVAEE